MKNFGYFATSITRHLTLQRGGQQSRLWPGLIALLLALSWLQPHHYYPIPGFHKEAWTACWFALALLSSAVLMKQPIRLGWMPAVFLMLAGWVWIQWAMGMQTSMAQTLMISATLLGAALVWIYAQQLQAQDPYLVLDTLMLAIGIAGIISVGLCFYQLFDLARESLARLDMWIVRNEAGSRPAANMSQPNQLATVLSWAWVAGLWGWHRGKLSVPTLAFYLAFIALGQGMAQSRIGLLQSMLICLVCVVWMLKIRSWKLIPALALGLATHLCIFFFLESIAQSLLLTQLGRDVQSLAQDHMRLTIYNYAIHGIEMHPWLGWGLREVNQLQWALTGQLPSIDAYITFTHNLALDLMVWLGIPLALLVLAALSIWLIQAVSKTQTPAGYVAMMAVGVFLLHSLVEFPYWGTNLLLWLMAVAGVWSAEARSKPLGSIRRPMGVFLSTVVLSVAVLSWKDYIHLEENFRHLRAEQNRIARVPLNPEPTWIMHHLQENLRMSRIVGLPGTSKEDLDWMESTVTSGPNYGVQFILITNLALASESDRARMWMARLDSAAPPEVRSSVRVIWKRFQKWYPDQLGNFQWYEPASTTAREK